MSTVDEMIPEFSLLPDNKLAIQECLETYWDDLHSADTARSEAARKELRIVLENNLPEQALDAIGNTWAGISDGWLGHNFPERTGFENSAVLKPEDTYGYHIGRELYALKGARHIRTATGTRESHIPEKKKKWSFDTLTIHRDGLQAPLTIEDPATFGEYIIFTSPYNGEGAPIEIIQLRRAIESLPESVREKVFVQITDRASNTYEIEALEPGDLNSLLTALKKFSPQHEYFVKEVVLESDPNLPETRKFLHAVKERSRKIVLVPGDFLAINEHNMFHCSHDGDEARIAKIPQDQPTSRHITHFAGTTIPRS